MQKLEQLYEGKAKKVFRTDDPELLIVDYKDDATAFNGLKKGSIAGKGVINNQMSILSVTRGRKRATSFLVWQSQLPSCLRFARRDTV